MRKIASKLCLFLAALLGALVAADSAFALVSRAWVSNHGSDSPGCATTLAPCRTLQYVVSNVIAPGGEIDVLDPGGYSPVVIPFSLNIVNDGVGVATVAQTSAGASAITVQAGPGDTVTLRGFTVEGFGAGANGLLLTSGGNLNVSHCVFRGFTNDGISIVPNSGASNVAVVVTDTTLAQNGNDGFDFVGLSYQMSSISGTLTRVEATGNGNTGVDMVGHNTFAVVNLVANEVVSSFNGIGFANRYTFGLSLFRSVATGNGTGVASVNGYVPFMHQDNLIVGNTNNFSGFSPSAGANGLY